MAAGSAAVGAARGTPTTRTVGHPIDDAARDRRGADGEPGASALAPTERTEIRLYTGVTGFINQNGRIIGVVTDKGETLYADQVLNAARGRNSGLEVGMPVVQRDGRLLIARRPTDARLGGMWEFPGTLRAPGEATAAAAERALFGAPEQARLSMRYLAGLFGASVGVAFLVGGLLARALEVIA